MTDDKLWVITDKAKRIRAFAALPITSQVSLLYGEILEARRFRIPLAAICAALNEAGSTVTVRYFREVLFVIRTSKPIAVSPSADQPTPKPMAFQPAPVEQDSRAMDDLTPTERRQKKAEFYASTNNPLLRQLK